MVAKADQLRRRVSSRRVKRKNSSAGEDLYQLESLKDYEVRNGVEYFLVKWEGYPDEQNTWEPVTNIVHPTQELIEQMKELRLMSQSSAKPSQTTKGTKKRKMETALRTRPPKSQRVSAARAASRETAPRETAPKETASLPSRRQPARETARETAPSIPVPGDESTPQSVVRIMSQEEEDDTSPEESGRRVDKETARGDGDRGDGDGEERLVREETTIEAVCKETQAQPFDNQENVFPVLGDAQEFLCYLSVVVIHTRVWRRENAPERVEVKKEKKALLEAAHTHTRELLAYFLRNVRYYKHSGGTRTTPPLTTPAVEEIGGGNPKQADAANLTKAAHRDTATQTQSPQLQATQVHTQPLQSKTTQAHTQRVIPPSDRLPPARSQPVTPLARGDGDGDVSGPRSALGHKLVTIS
eukprot:Gregarina_sp_Pseudo_9__4237@NODE_438_length_2829_cov_76_227599_g414_i0_p1_GENE_NODE_438_length_2829_cov_76_227599_g414_i0NODE_438_length_2829_cov_76_227599_g414_i0_p1_ORF_typecomplete_len414_score151_37Chromo/PF00385_24/3_2e10_NODE_438_length_2829_cov_76_227599_g414_i02281469